MAWKRAGLQLLLVLRLGAWRRSWQRIEARALASAEVRGSADLIPLPLDDVLVGGRSIDLAVVGANSPLALRCLPWGRRVALRVLHDGVVIGLRPVDQEHIILVVSGHSLGQQGASSACWPVVLIAQTWVQVDNARALAVRASTVDHERAASKYGLVVVLGHNRRRDRSVQSVPYGSANIRPVHKVLTNEVAVVRAMAGPRGKVDLVEVVNHPVDWIVDWTIRVVLPATMLIHQVEDRRILERLPAVVVARRARAIEANARPAEVEETEEKAP
mmetsp:Transcript_106014/g.236504  ORF Transcript_106014/g.236504 Transcript_106014/m.236504 type:complete len:273 (+) Transcript_106014:751-1569(+)